MKCPECGFECLPNDVECLACGIDIVLAAENKEKERIRGLEAAERKAKYDMEFKKELGLIPDDEKQDHGVAQKSSTLEETFKKPPICPKCGMERQPNVPECLRCGVIFQKLEPQHPGGITQPKAPPVLPAGTDIQEKAPLKSPENIVRQEDKTGEIDLADLKMLSDLEKEPEPADTTPEIINEPDEPTLEMESSTPPMMTETTPNVDSSSVSSEGPAAEHPMQQGPASIDVPNLQNDTHAETGNSQQPSISGANDKTEIIQTKIRRSEDRVISGGLSGFAVFRKKSRVTLEKFSGFVLVTSKKLNDKLKTSVIKARDMLNKLSGSKEKSAKILGVMALILVFALATPFGVSYYKTSKIERLKREHAEKLEKIRVDFVTNKDEITQKITLIISNKLFDSAEKEIALYDIPSLQDELVPLKNYLKEIRLYEKAKTIPALEFEQNYNAFSELLRFNSGSQLYHAKQEFYRQKLANNEYSLAESYLTSKSKSLPELKKAIVSIDKALEMYPASKRFILLKKKLLTENLLFYEGNENIVMAVQDDGMGKKLYSNQRKLTIWLKNISQETVYINVQFFTMIGQDKKRYTYNDIGRRFKTKLMPGEQTRGELYFRTRARPEKIVFSHLISGEISRVFP